MNFSYYIAQRYLKSKSRHNAINIITKIASVGIIVGAMALFVVLSVFSGLREFSLSFTNDFDPDYKILPKTGKSFLVTTSQLNALKKIDGSNYSQVVEERVLFTFNKKQQVTYLKGVDQNFIKINKISSNLFNGQWLKPNTYQVVMGYGISQKLSVGVFDFNNPLEVMVPRPGKGDLGLNPEEAFNEEYLLPVGIYAINEELDSKYVFCDLGLAQELLEFKPNEVSAIEVKTKGTLNEADFKNKITSIFGKNIQVQTRAQLNATLYKMLNTENFVLYLIFTLVFIMILFAFVGSVIMVIIDKKENLKTLFSLGTTVKSLRKIFLLYGILLCSIGGIIGIALGSIIIFLQQKFSLIMITSTLPYPVVFSFENVLLVFITITFLGTVASYIASSRVNKNLLENK